MLKKLALAAIAVGCMGTAAMAADLVVETPTAPPVVDNNFTWDGAYIGAFLQGRTAPAAFGLGVDFGVNALMSNFVIGGELELVAATGPNFSGQATAHFGGLINDSAMLYAYTGLGTRTPTSWYVPLGVGVEFAVASNMGIKAEAQYNFDLTSSAQNSAAIKVGLNWHF